MGNKAGSQASLKEELCEPCYHDYKTSLSLRKLKYVTWGADPILEATRRGHAQCLRALIEAEPFVVQRKNRKEVRLDALNITAKHGHGDCERVLIGAGVDVNGVYGFQFALRQAAESGQKEILEYLIKKGASVNKIHSDTALCVAAMCDQYGCVDVLLKAGADVNTVVYGGNTTLILAAECGKNTCVNLLIQAGADVNAVNNRGCTALLQASISGHISCTKTLLQAGADVNVIDKHGESALLAVVRIISCFGTETTEQQLGRVESLKLLLLSGAKVNLVGVMNFDVLCYLIDRKGLYMSTKRTMVLLLYAAGETLDGIIIDDDDDNTSCVLDWLEKREEICLKRLCRETIRNHLLKLNCHDNLQAMFHVSTH